MNINVNKNVGNKHVKNVSRYFGGISIADKYIVLAAVTMFFFVSAVYSVYDVMNNDADAHSDVILHIGPLQDLTDVKFKKSLYITARNRTEQPKKIKVKFEYDGYTNLGGTPLLGEGEYIFDLKSRQADSQIFMTERQYLDMSDVNYRIVSVSY